MDTDKFNLRAELLKLESTSFTPKQKLQIVTAMRSQTIKKDSAGFREDMSEIMFHHTHSNNQERLAPHLIKLFFSIAEIYTLSFTMRRTAAYNLAIIGCEDHVDTNKVISQLRSLGKVAVIPLKEIIFRHTTPETEIVLNARRAISKMKKKKVENPFEIPDAVIHHGGRKKTWVFKALRKGERRQVTCLPNPRKGSRLLVKFVKA
ncbi:MAG: hypothetical protein GY852_10290 [bacterium]|nr:hypothetical protein [bacterium]